MEISTDCKQRTQRNRRPARLFKMTAPLSKPSLTDTTKTDLILRNISDNLPLGVSQISQAICWYLFTLLSGVREHNTRGLTHAPLHQCLVIFCCCTSTRVKLNLLNVRIGPKIKKDLLNNLLCPVYGLSNILLKWLRDQPRFQGRFPSLRTRLLCD